MLRRVARWTLVACLVPSACWAANDAFVGKWKLNATKSTLVDEMKVELVSPNTYNFTFSGATDAETIVANGTDQPGYGGTTLAVTIEPSGAWHVVRKTGTRTLISAIWTLSGDGNQLRDEFTYFQPNAPPSVTHYVYKRTAGTTGITGSWESVSQMTDTVLEMEIRPFEGDGLSFTTSSGATALSLKFDGSDYPSESQNTGPGATSSGHQVDQSTLEMSVKLKGKLIYSQQIAISSDYKTLTLTVHPAGQSKPNILVFDRE